MKFAAKNALNAGLGFGLAIAGVSAAHADPIYQPYYVVDRDTIQYASPPPPMDNGTYQARPSDQGHPTPWQDTSQSLQPLPESERQEPALYRFNNTAWVSAGTSFLNYKEAVKPIPDSEHGWLPTIDAGVDFMTHNNLYLSLEGTDSFGDANYDGALFDSNTNIYDIPFHGTTSETIYTLDAKVGQGIPVNQYVMFLPYFDGGFRYWNRNLGLGQTEDYHNFQMLGGLKLEVAPMDKLFLSAFGAGGTTIGGKMQTGGVSVELGNAAVYEVGGKIAYDITHDFELFSTVEFDTFRYGHSPTVAVSNTEGLMEPGSATEETTARVGVGYHFR